uniref:Alternative protein TTC12 n=1 Tax=Homo sapiens TaxID=9606 RepID=L8ECH5_HUMAN|nr:alternative protein TTC12 [Homo sapiens]
MQDHLEQDYDQSSTNCYEECRRNKLRGLLGICGEGCKGTSQEKKGKQSLGGCPKRKRE